MCGLLTHHCRDLLVNDNTACYCSGFGFHLYGTSYSVFEDNTADFCCRYEPRGPRAGHMGADAAGFLLVHSACWNVFRRNSARMSGDGFFLAGLTPKGKLVGATITPSKKTQVLQPKHRLRSDLQQRQYLPRQHGQRVQLRLLVGIFTPWNA